MRRVHLIVKTAVILISLLVGMGVTALPGVAQIGIPAGATIDSATFSIYVERPSGQTVNVHRITAAWTETGVTWQNFGGAFAPAVVGSFVPDAIGWRSVDVTALVQAWVDGTYPNYGLLLEQGSTAYAMYRSSEYGTVELRPKLEICYTAPSTGSTCVTIQRLGDGQGDVADAYIWEMYPDSNGGTSRYLLTGLVIGYEKQSLFRFYFELIPEPGPGTGTPGYWKNHPKAWPVEEITIGGELYTKAEAIALMKTSVKGDKTYTMFQALVAAKLNVEIGNPSGCIDSTISAADAWMATYGPVGEGVAGSSDAWEEGEPLYEMLDKYNNGKLCAQSRDDLE